jgi:hypothetical protein
LLGVVEAIKGVRGAIKGGARSKVSGTNGTVDAFDCDWRSVEGRSDATAATPVPGISWHRLTGKSTKGRGFARSRWTSLGSVGLRWGQTRDSALRIG